MANTIRALLCLATLVTLSTWAAAADTARSEEESFVVIHAGRVITMTGPDLRNVDILIVNGKIRLVGQHLGYPYTAKVIDARNQVVMPGMICARTRYQLTGYSRAGVHGDWTAAREVTLSRLDLSPFVRAGFTTVAMWPEGSGIPGRAALFRTATANAKQDLGTGYVRVTMTSPARDKNVLRGAIAKARQEIEKVEKARKAWDEKQKKAKEAAAAQDKKETAEKPAKEDAKKPEAQKTADKPADKAKDAAAKPAEKKEPEKFTPPKIDPAVLPLVEWIRDKKGPALLFEVQSAAGVVHLRDALKQTPEVPVKMLYVGNGYYQDMHHVVPILGKAKTLVLLQARIGTLPYTATRYNLPGELAAAGCQVALLPTGDNERAIRDCRLQLSELVRAGMPRTAVLAAVTRIPAQILGIQDRVGSIEKDKDADLIFMDGDPLAPGTKVTRTMTLGNIVWEADDHHE